jgi:hypothetical protein
MTLLIRRTIYVVFGTLMLGCASAAGTKGASGGGSGVTLNTEQLSKANTDNLYDAIVRLRPNWLTSRGPSSIQDSTPTGVDVFIGNVNVGKAEYMQQVRPGDVAEVRYWDPGSATARFGSGHVRGVIEITRK